VHAWIIIIKGMKKEAVGEGGSLPLKA